MGQKATPIRPCGHPSHARLCPRHCHRGIAWIVQIYNDPQQKSGFRQVLVTNRSSYTLNGLTSSSKYWFRVAANGAAGQGP